MPSRSGVTSADARGAIEARQRGAAVGAVDIADRRPGRFAIGAVDAAGRLADRALHLGIFLDLGAALRRDLQIGDLAVPVRIDREEALEGIQPLREALGIVEPVDADHQARPARLSTHVAHERRAHAAPRQPLNSAVSMPIGKTPIRTDALAGLEGVAVRASASGIRPRDSARNWRRRSRSGSRPDRRRSIAESAIRDWASR